MADMFQIAEIGATLPDAAFERMQSKLRLDMIRLQQKARAQGRPALIILNGVRGAGVIDTVNLLNTWMDPRWISTIAFDTPSDEERERPLFWRYWRSLPAAGSIGLYLGGWYSEPIAARCDGTMSAAAFKARLKQINAFEDALAAEGAMILKFWLHVSEPQQRKILPRVNRDPLIGFRASDNTWVTPKNYTTFTNVSAQAIRATSDENRPWFVVEGTDDNYRRASVLSALSSRLDKHCKAPPQPGIRKGPRKAKRNYLKAVAQPDAMSDEAYVKAFHKEQMRLHDLQFEARKKGISTVIAFEGWDAAGKGGAIRRLTYALNARDYKIVPISAPNEEERKYHYLWRFWRQLGRAGDMTVFDRSWYGRVLVERVEKLIDKATLARAYDEINDFERQLWERGHIIVKFWLHITKDEQKRRFKERKNTPYKTWKLTEDDHRNRKKWAAYEHAVNDMLENTSTSTAPWTLIGANDKQHTRIKVLQAVSSAMEEALKKRSSHQ
jgi:polyphosphate:AMP phosphotransferase